MTENFFSISSLFENLTPVLNLACNFNGILKIKSYFSKFHLKRRSQFWFAKISDVCGVRLFLLKTLRWNILRAKKEEKNKKSDIKGIFQYFHHSTYFPKEVERMPFKLRFGNIFKLYFVPVRPRNLGFFLICHTTTCKEIE